MDKDLQIISLKIDKLLFDPENPRLPIKHRGYSKDEEVIDWMLMKESVVELMGSIGEKGYFKAEPLLVVKSSKLANKYEVIEGNRRLAALKLLNKPNLAKYKKNSIAEIIKDAKVIPTEVPVIEFSKREDILIYLGYRHITGIKEWGALAKAKYLEELRKTLKIKNQSEEYKTLAKIIGSSTSYVRSILSGLRIYKVIEENNFFDIPNLDEVTVEFGVLYTAVNRRNIATFIGLTEEKTKPNLKHLQEFTSWMFEKNSENFTRLGESRNIQDLDKVVGNNVALKQFRSGRPLSEAVLYTSKPLTVYNNSINECINKLKVARDQSDHIDVVNSDMIEGIEDIIKIASNIRLLINAKLNEAGQES